MSDDHHDSGDLSNPRRRPPPPTIDLTATEVPGAAGAGQDSPGMAEPERPPEEAQARPDAGTTDVASPPSEASAHATAEDAPSNAGGAPPETPPDGAEPEPSPPPARKGKFSSFVHGIPWAALGGGIAGAMMVLLLAAGLRNMVPQPGDNDVDDRLARVESQLKTLAARPTPTSVAPKALDDLAARVARLEQTRVAPRGPDAAVDNRLSALEASTKSLADGVADLNRRADETAAALRAIRGEVETAGKETADLSRQASAQRPAVTRADLDQLGHRVAALEAATASLKNAVGQVASHPPEVTRADLDQLGGRIAALEGATASLKDAVGKVGEPARATRVAVLAFALDRAVERGVPYAAELDAVRPLVADAAVLAPLQPFAKSGVPGLAALGSELAAVKLPGAPAPARPAAGGFLDRLQANAERLVRIRPLNQAQGDEPAAIVARMQGKVAHGDVAGAIADTAKLPADARAAVDGWAKRAAARQAAIAAAQRLSAESLAALGRGANEGSQQK